MKSILKNTILVFAIILIKPTLGLSEIIDPDGAGVYEQDVLGEPIPVAEKPSARSGNNRIALEAIKLDCISDGLRDYTKKKFGTEITPSEKWLAFLGVGVNMFTSTKAGNTNYLNASKNPEDKKVLLRNVIRLVEANGFCNADADTKISNLTYKDISFVPGYVEIKAFNGEVRGTEKGFVMDYVSGLSYRSYNRDRDDHYNKAMSEIFGVNKSGFEYLFKNIAGLSSQEIANNHFDNFLNQALIAEKKSATGSAFGSQGSYQGGQSTYFNTENYNFPEMKSCLQQISKRKKSSPYFQPDTRENIDMCNSMVKSCGLTVNGKLEAVCQAPKQAPKVFADFSKSAGSTASSDPFLKNAPGAATEAKPVATKSAPAAEPPSTSSTLPDKLPPPPPKKSGATQ